MAGDISRSTFNPSKRYTGVRQQQGRVNLDADWNEQVDIATHRLSLETVDLVGPASAPRDTAGFAIGQPGPSFAANDLTISAGRMYVAGRLCEIAAGPVPIENFTGDGTAAAGTQVQLASTVVDGIALQPGQWVELWAQGSPAPAPLLVQITAVNAAAGSVTFASSVSSLGSPNTSPQLQRVTTYLTQPDYPAPPPLPTSGSAIAYLDVWERTMTALDDPSIEEIALGGADTATRTKTVWQLKLLPVPAGTSCSTPDSAIAGWQSLITPSAGQLTTGVVPSAGAGACTIASNSGFTGIENQLYRVEIHQPGTPAAGPLTYPVAAGVATFKWSRDNGSVATGVTAITATASSAGVSTSQLTVLSTGRDAVLSFSPQNWVEVTDDYLVLMGQPGELHQIDSNGVDQTRATITLKTPVSAALLARLTAPINYHTRVTRWDQGGQVLVAGTGTLWADLTVAAATGDIPVPPAGTALVLENGVTVSFSLSSATGSLNAADSWSFAARTADGSVESLTQAAPSAIRHDLCRLATISFDATPWAISDCRQLFAPMADPGVHVTAISLIGQGQGLLNDSTISVQQLASGISVVCDGAIDPATVTQPTSTQVVAPNTQSVSGWSQATCFVTIRLPIVSGNAIYGFQSFTLSSTVALDTSQTTIQWKPTAAAIAGLTSQMSTLATQTSTAVPPTIPSLLAHLILKGDAIWSLNNPEIYLDGETFGTPYLDANGVQHTGLQLPSGDGRRGGDFSMWFWLTSSPALTISSTSLGFVPTPVGVASQPLSLTLSNTTAAALPVTFAITGNFAQTNTSGGSLAAGASCTINVTFTPAAAGALTGQLTITSGNTVIAVPLSGTGVAFQLSILPSRIDFGGQVVNTTGAPETITLTNSGAATTPVGITSISNASANFVHSTTCASLAAGASCTITVQFTPKVTGAISDALTIVTTPAGLVTPIVLTGTGTQPKNETKDLNDSKSIRDGKLLRDKGGQREQVINRPIGAPVLDIHPAIAPLVPAEEAVGRAFIQPEERPAVGRQALDEPAPEEAPGISSAGQDPGADPGAPGQARSQEPSE